MRNDKAVIQARRLSIVTASSSGSVRSKNRNRPASQIKKNWIEEEDSIIPFLPSSVVLEVQYDSHFKLRDEAELLFAV